MQPTLHSARSIDWAADADEADTTSGAPRSRGTAAIVAVAARMAAARKRIGRFQAVTIRRATGCDSARPSVRLNSNDWQGTKASATIRGAGSETAPRNCDAKKAAVIGLVAAVETPATNSAIASLVEGSGAAPLPGSLGGGCRIRIRAPTYSRSATAANLPNFSIAGELPKPTAVQMPTASIVAPTAMPAQSGSAARRPRHAAIAPIANRLGPGAIRTAA